jgi:O-antigen ligase
MRLGFCAAVLTMVLLSFGAHRRPHFNGRLLTLLAAAVPLIALAVLMFSGQILRYSSLDRFAGVDPSNPDGTTNWRLIWWQHLYEHVMETNPLVGIGFGESLHIYNPLLEDDDEEFVVRSPHNFNVTVFTRMGISGLCLWAGVLIVGIGGLCRRVVRGTARGHPYTEARRDELAFWVSMLVCTVVNSSFGVLMEGPVLGIWFWFALGFATGRSLTTGDSTQRARQYLRRLILQQAYAASLSAAEA